MSVKERMAFIKKRDNSVQEFSPPRLETKGKTPEQFNKTKVIQVKKVQVNQMAQYLQIYLMETQQDGSNKIIDYKSLHDLKQKRFLRIKGSTLQGCIERNGAYGSICIKPFRLSIKSLDSEFEFQKNFKLYYWQKIIGFMQHRSALDPEKPKQFVEYICQAFQKALEKKERCNALRAKKLSRLDPKILNYFTSTSQYEPKQGIVFGLKQVLNFKKEYKMLSSDQEIESIIAKYAENFAEGEHVAG